MEPSSDTNSSELPQSRSHGNSKSKATDIKIAWAITIGEILLLGALSLVFAKYWLMLPIRFRYAGLFILTSLGAFVIFRLVRCYRR